MKISELINYLSSIKERSNDANVRIVGLDRWVTSINKDNIKIGKNHLGYQVDIEMCKENKLYRFG
jgi:hydrogenase maturation factor